MRYIVFIYDADEQQVYLPLVEAPDKDAALGAAGEAYSNCYIADAFEREDVEHMIHAIDTAQPDITVKR